MRKALGSMSMHKKKKELQFPTILHSGAGDDGARDLHLSLHGSSRDSSEHSQSPTSELWAHQALFHKGACSVAVTYKPPMLVPRARLPAGAFAVLHPCLYLLLIGALGCVAHFENGRDSRSASDVWEALLRYLCSTLAQGRSNAC